MRAIAALLTLSTSVLLAQGSLHDKIIRIAAEAKGKVAVACAAPGMQLDCDVHANTHPPMQSVFKLPLVVTVFSRIEHGDFQIDQPVRYLTSDRIPGAYSPLQDKYPKGDVDVPLRELMRLAVSYSDNVAADILLRILGGPAVVDRYIASLGVQGFHLQDSEATSLRDRRVQYRNWFEPAGAVVFLTKLVSNPPLNQEHTRLLLSWMEESPVGSKRLGGMLPAGTVVAHKTGTSGTHNGITAATNDIGLIRRPDGSWIAIAVFVSEAAANEATREAVIARIARAIYEAANGR